MNLSKVQHTVYELNWLIAKLVWTNDTKSNLLWCVTQQKFDFILFIVLLAFIITLIIIFGCFAYFVLL